MTGQSVGVLDLQPEVQSFLSTSIDLKKLLRDVARESKNAVQALVLLLGSQDEKIRLTAAKAIVELHVNVAKEVNDDQLKRLVAEVKLNHQQRRLVAVDDKEDDRPLVDFTTVREIV